MVLAGFAHVYRGSNHLRVFTSCLPSLKLAFHDYNHELSLYTPVDLMTYRPSEVAFGQAVRFSMLPLILYVDVSYVLMSFVNVIGVIKGHYT